MSFYNINEILMLISLLYRLLFIILFPILLISHFRTITEG
jgi:hypothetical protein